MEDARENSFTYHTPPLYEQVNTITSTTLEMQRNMKSGSAAFFNIVLGKVTRYIGTILTSIYKKYEAELQAIKY